jgi:hypothetical protein
MYFVNDLPVVQFLLPKQAVHDSHRTIRIPRPTAAKYPGVVKSHNTFGNDKSMPILPIAQYGVRIVVPVEE